MELTRQQWEHTHQHFEAGWWGDCCNTYGEETKQIAYAKLMGLDPGPWLAGNAWPVWDLAGSSVVDLGGGPVSMLLKCKHLGNALVVDPCPYPPWTQARYATHKIDLRSELAEDWLEREGAHAQTFHPWDEAWCYNVLQHTHDPEAIIRGMRKVATTIRVFEWIETEEYLGHPHSLHADQLNEWVGGVGTVVKLDEQYQPIPTDAPDADWRVEQLAWGGVFEGE